MKGIKQLFEVLVSQKASDLYLTVGAAPAYRIEGRTVRVGEALNRAQLEAIASALMTEAQRAEFDQELEMNLALALPDLGRFRVNVFRQRGCPGVVIRRIEGKIPTLDQLRLPAAVSEIMHAKRGLILVVGATGSGKSTSLAAMIDYWNSHFSGHIVTIEDPVEFVHEHQLAVVTQREVGVDTHSFDAALKNALRQAPDVILLGEIRDAETMQAAISFAETGHLCLGTLHANNANQAIERVLNFFPADRHPQILMQLSLNLRAVLSQRLVPSADGKRAAAVEILRNTPRVGDLVKRGEIDLLKVAMTEGIQDGMQSFDQALFALHRAGRVDYDTALAHADSANDLRLRIKLAHEGEASRAATAPMPTSTPAPAAATGQPNVTVRQPIPVPQAGLELA